MRDHCHFSKVIYIFTVEIIAILFVVPLFCKDRYLILATFYAWLLISAYATDDFEKCG